MGRASGPKNRIQIRIESAGNEFSYQPGAKPRVYINEKKPRAEGPPHRVFNQSRLTVLLNRSCLSLEGSVKSQHKLEETNGSHYYSS